MCSNTKSSIFFYIEDALNFASKKLFTSDSVPHKKLDMLFWNDLSFAIIVKLRDYCLTKISVELNPIKFFCNNNEIEIIGTLISFPAKWQFFNTKSKEAPMLHTVWRCQDFTVIQILREINFGECRASKTAVLAIYGVLLIQECRNS